MGIGRHRPRALLGRVIAACSLLSWLWCSLARADELVHGLWVWKGPSVIADAGGMAQLRDFCISQGVNEIYISVSEHGVPHLDAQFAHFLDLMHRAHIRVEALLSSENADEAGQHRARLIEHVQAVLQFNQRYGRSERFDGIHLDIEPQQRPENKGAGNLRFLPGLVDTYREVSRLIEPTGLALNADIQRKLLEGSTEQRRALLSSLPRLTLMLYELSRADDGDGSARKLQKLLDASAKLLAAAYEGLAQGRLARLVIGLRTPDYGPLTPAMLAGLDRAYGTEPHYQGWAWHEYADAARSMSTADLR